ncbi:cytochrome P450 [Kitasatospora sp. NPDC059673]|uniref:cytochrome P450 family protein n=1 Tax=Kitasatospora sp. NPDC059673 TaxID=3346901 RepID=UPI0036A18846
MLDPSGRALLAEAAVLRAQGPAVLVELPGPVHAWSVTRHSVIEALTTDPRVSRDFRRHWPGRTEVPEGWPLAAIAFQESFLNAYGEEHRRLRRRNAPAFSPQRVERMRPNVQAAADRLVAALAALPPGTSADLRETVAKPLTMTVICDLFGVPDHLRTPLIDALEAIRDYSVSPERGRVIQAELLHRLTELLQYKREHPAPDLTSDLILPSESDQEPMSEPELISTLFSLIAAGYEAPIDLIASAVHFLLTHPDTLAGIRQGTLDWDDVIEETLRIDGPVMHVPLRYAVEDIDLGEGVVIKKGDPIIIAFAAAGRDPELHPENPDRFDPARAGKKHLAFGHGPHYCLGAYLARLEARIALTTLFAELPDLALTHPGQQPPRVTSMIVNGPENLNIIPRPAT